MYQNYFGFKERPFQLVPNPTYLFLSNSHEEALAHLAYATAKGDGFIAITGEVGTGKTTLCRAFIESLDERCEVAYIFNPKLTASELLRTVCDEFGIHTPTDSAIKDLIDQLNRFLLEKKEEGKQVMLIIDEAQNLSRGVLEQIRLLSNLETSTEKLLQIVLVGQPELMSLLDTHELRQLNQRITLTCHLSPLTYPETVQYILHRIGIAARNRTVEFTSPAFRKIHTFSRGVPRLINIICERSLLTAYVTNRQKITRGIVSSAIRELSPRGEVGRRRTAERRKTLLLAMLLLLLVGCLLFTLKPIDSAISPVLNSMKRFKISTGTPTSTPVSTSASTAPAASPAAGDKKSANPSVSPTAVSAPAPEIKAPAPPPEPRPAVGSQAPVSVLAPFLSGAHGIDSKRTALADALGLWKPDQPMRAYPFRKLVDPGTYFNLTSMENGFQVHRMRSDLATIERLNLPTIFEFRLSGKNIPGFLTLNRIDEGKLTFMTDTKGGTVDVPPKALEGIWSGVVYIPWINFYSYRGTTPISGPDANILILKRMLEKIGYKDLTLDTVYDADTVSAVKKIQREYGLPVDGFVGPLTKMVLYNELKDLEIPHIRTTGEQLRPGEVKVTE